MPSEFVNFSLNVIGPVVLMLTAGKLLRATKQINEGFISGGSKLVFNFALPALLFISIGQADFSQSANQKLITVGILGTSIFFILALVSVHFLFACRADRGVIVQGSFRANLGVIGLAYAANTFSSEDFAQASVYMGGLILLYNILSVWVLNHYLPRQLHWFSTVTDTLKNPIVLSILAALLFSYFEFELPKFLYVSTEYFAQLTLPLALLCTGAAIRFRGMQGHYKALVFATVYKCILYPLVLITIGEAFQLTETEILTVMFMAIAPTAAVSFIMVKNMGGNADLAANIVAITTVISIPVTLIGYAYII
jgi:hypothetical protein